MAYKFEKPMTNLSLTSNTVWDAFDFDSCDLSCSDDESFEINSVSSTLSFSNKLRADKGKVKYEDRVSFGLESCFEESDSDFSEDEASIDAGSYNKYAFVCMENANAPLLTIVEESWESEISL